MRSSRCWKTPGYAVDRRDKASEIAARGSEDADDELAQLVVSHPDDDPPVLVAEDFAEAAVWVDKCPDELFAPYLGGRDGGGAVRDIAWMRRMLAGWPREPLHVD
jgi:hypothetical protein